MKRKSMIVAMVMLAAILIASPVLAAGPGHPIEVAIKQPTVISLTGKIIAEDRSGTKVDVAIKMTNRAFIQYRGTTQTIDITDALCLEWVNRKKSVKINCETDLAPPDTVAIIAKVDRTDPENVTFTARRVQKKQPRIRIP